MDILSSFLKVIFEKLMSVSWEVFLALLIIVLTLLKRFLLFVKSFVPPWTINHSAISSSTYRFHSHCQCTLLLGNSKHQLSLIWIIMCTVNIIYHGTSYNNGTWFFIIYINIIFQRDAVLFWRYLFYCCSCTSYDLLTCLQILLQVALLNK